MPPSPVSPEVDIPPAIVVMGVAGAGKTVVGERLAERLDLPFLEGDSFHPPENVAKMSAGTPLGDDDRWPWLDAIGRAMAETARLNGGVVAACSALKRAYRQRLTASAGLPIVFVLLDGSRATLERRLGSRQGHFMPQSLLDSQLATLEPPEPGERAVVVSVEPPVEAVVEAAVRALSPIVGMVGAVGHAARDAGSSEAR
jgi:gluconokinase